MKLTYRRFRIVNREKPYALTDGTVPSQKREKCELRPSSSVAADLLGQTRVRIGISVGTADGHAMSGAVARQAGVHVPGHRCRVTYFFRANYLSGVTVTCVAVHLERRPVLWRRNENIYNDYY